MKFLEKFKPFSGLHWATTPLQGSSKAHRRARLRDDYSSKLAVLDSSSAGRNFYTLNIGSFLLGVQLALASIALASSADSSFTSRLRYPQGY